MTAAFDVPSLRQAASNDGLCDVIDRLYVDDRLVKFVFIVQFFTALLALICVTVLILLLIAWRTFAPSLRYLVISVCISLVVANIGVLLSSSYHLHVLMFRPADTRCYWFSFSFDDCFAIKTIYNVSLFSVYVGAAGIAVERTIGALLMGSSATAKKWISIGLVALQWGCSVAVALYPSPGPQTHFAHCSAHIPSPTQMRRFFYLIAAMQVFVLAMYTVLWYHYGSALVTTELERFNFAVYENVRSIEGTFPIVASVVLLWLLNIAVDYNFFVLTESVFHWADAMPSSRDLVTVSKWSEFQLLATPLVSLFVFVFLARHAWPANADDAYERVVGEYAQNLEHYYENRSDAWSFHGDAGTKCSQNEGTLKMRARRSKSDPQENRRVIRSPTRQKRSLDDSCVDRTRSAADPCYSPVVQRKLTKAAAVQLAAVTDEDASDV